MDIATNYLKKMLNNINSNIYILFGYRQYEKDMNKYICNYEVLKEDKGFLKIINIERDIEMIKEMAEEFQIFFLLFSSKNILDYSFGDLRQMSLSQREYIFDEGQLFDIDEIGAIYYKNGIKDKIVWESNDIDL